MKKGLSPRDSLQCIGSVGNNGRRSTPHNQTKLNKNIIIIMWCGEHELSNRRNVCMDCVFVMLARTLLVCTNIPSLFSYTFMLLLLFTHTDFWLTSDQKLTCITRRLLMRMFALWKEKNNICIDRLDTMYCSMQCYATANGRFWCSRVLVYRWVVTFAIYFAHSKHSGFYVPQ